MIDGVCGGVAEYFGIDPTLVRIVWVLITLLGGSGLFLYIAAMIIMPVNPEDIGVQAAAAPPVYRTRSDQRRFWGIILVLIGAFVLMMNLGWIADIGWWSFSHKVVFPLLLILLGGVLLLTYTRRVQEVPPPASGTSSEADSRPIPPMPVKELRRSIKDRKLFGVCGGLGEYFGLDSTIVRIVYIFLVLASFGWALLLYIILGLVMPEEKPVTTST